MKYKYEVITLLDNELDLPIAQLSDILDFPPNLIEFDSLSQALKVANELKKLEANFTPINFAMSD